MPSIAVIMCCASVFLTRTTSGHREKLSITTKRWLPPGISRRSAAMSFQGPSGSFVDRMGSGLVRGPTS